MKSLSKALFIAYLLTLLWLVLFKFSVDIPGVLNHQTRTFNLILFSGFTDHSREIIDNFIVFVPFGLLLGVNFKRFSLQQKLSYIFFFSLAVEILQFVLGIGVADITDIAMNTLGGLFGLAAYDFNSKHVHSEKRDRYIVVAGTILLTVLILLRFMVFRIRY